MGEVDLVAVVAVAEPLGAVLAFLLAGATAFLVDAAVARSTAPPPGFADPVRRLGMGALLAGLFYMGAYAPLLFAGKAQAIDVSTIGPLDLFGLHGMLVLGLAGWFLLGYPLARPWRALANRCGLEAERGILSELAFGLGFGLVLWLVVVLGMAGLAATLTRLGLGELTARELPEVIKFMAALPVGVRVALAVSAGLVEEVFFRGFLQPRIGGVFSSLLFVLAHVGYGEPFMLVGVTALSVAFALLVVRRGNVWAAVAAHFTFDAIQLLWLIPAAQTFDPAAGLLPAGLLLD